MKVYLKDHLLTFDGEVVELFSAMGGSDRYHVRFLQKLELVSGRKGITLFNMRNQKGGGVSGFIVLEESVEDARRFVAAVQEAIDSYE